MNRTACTLIYTAGDDLSSIDVHGCQWSVPVAVVLERWRRSRVHNALRLGGYVAFALPRTVTTLATLLLLGVATAHSYVLWTHEALPLYFVGYAGVLIVGCCATAGTIWLAAIPSLPQVAWRVGSLVSVLFLGAYVVSRAVSVPGLVGLTGRWDFTPGTFAAAFALGFLAVHASVLLDINVAYPHLRNWHD